MIRMIFDPWLIASVISLAATIVAIMLWWSLGRSWRRALIVELCLVLWIATTAALIKSGATSDYWTIDPTSKAGRVSLYDTRGNHIGQEITYGAGLTIRTNTAAGTNPFFSICGSSSKIIRVKRLYINGSVATAAVRGDIILKKTSSATSGGTATALTQVPFDPNSPAGTASLVNYYTALATPGTSVGVVGTWFQNFPITATIASTDQLPGFLFDVRGIETEPITLRTTSHCLEANFGTTTTNAPTLVVHVVWTEATN